MLAENKLQHGKVHFLIHRLFGRKSEIEERFESIVDYAGLWDSIDRPVRTYSSGMFSRLAFSVGMAMEPSILLLDDCLSAVDTHTEARIQQAIARLVEGRTTFAIAHRLSTIENADHIVVMDKGHIVEQGTHAELIAIDGYYAMLHSTDFTE